MVEVQGTSGKFLVYNKALGKARGIEVKIDALRMEMQENHEEDELGLVTKDDAKISAGGIDGGFSASQLKEILN